MQMNFLFQKGFLIGTILLIIVMVSNPAFCQSGLREDTTPPVTTVMLDPPEPNGNNGWYISDVTVILNATDNESGVNVTYYQIDNGLWQIYHGPFLIFADGIHGIRYYSVDFTGNIESEKSVELRIDQTSPTVNLIIDLRWRFRPELFVAECNDETSGMDRVDFYLNDGPYYRDFEEPFELLLYPWPSLDIIRLNAMAYDKAGNFHYSESLVVTDDCYYVYGFIRNLTFIDHNISFFALIVNGNCGLVLFKQVTRTVSNNYFGYIGKFFINAFFI